MTLTPAVRRELYTEDGSEAVLYLITLEHEDWPDPIRLVDNNEDLVVNGETFIGWPMSVRLPDELDDQDRSISIQVSAVKRDILQELRKLSSPPRAFLELILSGDPDTTRVGPFAMDLDDIGFDSMSISGDLIFADLVNDTYPKQTFTPQNSPGLFRT